MADEPLARLCASADPRGAPATAIVVAHPDDEVIGAGGRLPFLSQTAVLIHATDGSPRNMFDARAAGFATREEYGQARRRELEAALRLAGWGMEQTRSLGLIDQEASLDLVGLSFRLAEVLAELRPDIALTFPYEGGHPDHDATAFAVHAACCLLRREGLAPPPILEMTSYHNKGGVMSTFEFLPADCCEAATVVLSEERRTLKRRMVECFSTQARTLAAFPSDLERFRLAPHYDFAQAPHTGALYYELFDWGMTGERWRGLARQALDDLGMDGLL